METKAMHGVQRLWKGFKSWITEKDKDIQIPLPYACFRTRQDWGVKDITL